MKNRYIRIVKELKREGLISPVTSMSLRIPDYKMAITTPYPSMELISISYIRKELRWEEGSWDTPIHAKIYRRIERAKGVLFLFLPELLAIVEKEKEFKPIDLWGKGLISEMGLLELETEIEEGLVSLHRKGHYRESTIFPTQLDAKFIQPLIHHLTEKNIIIIPQTGVYIVGRSWEELLRKGLTLYHSALLLLNR